MATTGNGHTTSPGFGADWQASSRAGSDRRAAGNHATVRQLMRDSAYRTMGTQKARASDTLGSLAGAVRSMGQQLRSDGQPWASDYIVKAADELERWAGELQRQDIEAAIRRLESFARKEPALFLGAAFATGILVARFLKASHRDTSLSSFAGDTLHAVSDRAQHATDFGSSQFGAPSDAEHRS